MSVSRVKDIILNQIMMEVIHGHNAIAVYMAISEHSQALNESHFRQTFGSLQQHAFDAFILSICKLYEKSSKPNYSIPTTLKLLQKDSSKLGINIQNCLTLEQFIKDHVNTEFTVQNQNHIERIPELLLEYFFEECPRTPARNQKELDMALDALKVIRDKRVAHHEDIDLSSLSKTDLNGAMRLLAFAQTYVNIIGYGLFGFLQKGKAYPVSFAPSKSFLWPEMNRMIKLLEQGH